MLASSEEVFLLVVIIVPGFITLNILRKMAVINRKMSQFEETIWSLFCSLFIILVLTQVSGAKNFEALFEFVFQPLHFLLYLFCPIGLSVLFAFLLRLNIVDFLRKIVWFKSKVKIHPISVWSKFFEDAKWVGVLTKHGEFRGWVKSYSRGGKENELTLGKPTKIFWVNEQTKEVEVGDEMLINRANIECIMKYKDTKK